MIITVSIKSNIRRLFVLLMVALIVTSLSVTVFAASADETTAVDSDIFVDLDKCAAYGAMGFEPEFTLGLPTSARRFSDGDFRVLINIFPNFAPRPFLSVAEEAPIEFTLMIPFELGSREAAMFESGEYPNPALYLAGIGPAWEVYLNGTLIESQMYLDEDGAIDIHRTVRGVGIAFDSALLHEGDNMLAFRIVGPPSADDTGMFYARSHYIGNYKKIMEIRTDYITVILCTIYLFVGFYHMLLFAVRRRDRENLYYGLFSICTGLYFVTRSPVVHDIILASEISQKVEYSLLYIVFFCLTAFLENLTYHKTLIISRIYGAIAFILIAVQTFAPVRFMSDALTLWQPLAAVMLVYIVVYLTIYAFVLGIRRDKQRYPDDKTSKVVRRMLFTTVLGNIAITMSLLVVSALYDIIDLVTLRTGIMTSRYTFFIFTLSVAVTLARRYANLYSEATEARSVLEQSNASLEVIVAERTRELAKQVEIAESASQAKSAFMATMSHEIRTPLNAIIGLGEIELANAQIPAHTRSNLVKITASGKTLLHIINDILDISKIEAGSFEIVPVEYKTVDMLAETVQINAVRIGKKPIVLELHVAPDLPTRLRGDEIRLRQILNNLLSNAIKYTREGTVSFSISCELDAVGRMMMIFVIRDTGIGIRPEDMEKLFVEYAQLDMKANRKIEGTGLGLAITKRLSDMMGGEITVKSEYGAGSEFCLRLPIDVLDATPIGSVAAQNIEEFRVISGSDEGKPFAYSRTFAAKVLVVDDVQVNLDVAEGLLLPYGLTIECVLRAQEAIERIKGGAHYDMILMDHMMPEMDGLEATRIIRNEIDSDYARTVPIVALTANALSGNEEMFLANGFDDYITKPIDIGKLDALLVRRLSGQPEVNVNAMKSALQCTVRDVEFPATDGVVLVGIDMEAGIARYGDEGMFKRLLRSFAKSTPALVDKLRNPTEEELADYVVNVHGFKGGCYGVSANELGKLAEELEHAGKAGDFATIAAKNAQMIAAADALYIELQKLGK